MSLDSAPRPLVSIGIPTFNRRDYLLQCVHSALAQTYTNIEVIVSDNASTDDTWQYLTTLNDPRLVLIRQPSNAGMVGNFNACLFAATGDLFILLSDDDLLEPAAIERLSEPFRSPDASTIGLSWCPSTIIDATGRAMWTTDPGPALESPTDLLYGLFTGRRGTRLSAILIRRNDSIELRGYNEARHGVLCDTGNWGRIALKYPFVHCAPQSLVQYRVHAASLTTIANCADWQRYGDNIHEDFLTVLHQNGKAAQARQLTRGFSPHLANITVTVLLRFFKTPGWIKLYAREFWRSRRFMLTPFVAGRIARDGWKLLRTPSGEASQ